MNLFQSLGTVGMEAAMIALNLLQFPPQSSVRDAHPVPPDQKQDSSHTSGEHHTRNQKD
jgi:hypothetical protein